MKQTIWTCDRCAATTTAEREVVIVEDWTPSAVDTGCTLDKSPGWLIFADDERVTDVCPNCITADERAAELLGDIELDHALGIKGDDL